MFKTTICTMCMTTMFILADGALAATINVPADEPTIQAGIDAALDGDEIVVAPGEFFENINFLGKAITVRSTDPTDPSVVDATIINGNAAGTVVTFASGEGPGSILDGLTITNGIGTGSPGSEQGGGIRINAASPVVRRCLVTGNSAFEGAGISSQSSGALIEDCTLDGNSASGKGGGLFSVLGTLTVSQCTISNNDSFNGAGCAFAGASTVTGCTITGNSAVNHGGGFFGVPFVTNCVISGNSAWQGGAFFAFLGEYQLTNCTVVGNTAGHAGGGFLYWHTTPDSLAALTMTNCIFWGNIPEEIAEDGPDSFPHLSFFFVVANYSNMQGGYFFFDSIGVIDADPLFVDPDGPDDEFGTDDDDLRLAAFSPCIDAGDNSAPGLDGITMDLAGGPRFLDDILTPDTGVGRAPIVDMGAYENQPVPDCSKTFVDCNENGVCDSTDIVDGTSADCNENGVPDECEVDLTAHAVAFDGVDDYIKVDVDVSEAEYTMSMWFKTTCGDCGLYQVADGVLGAGGLDRSVYLSDGNLNARLWSEETITTSGTNFADGEWHQVVHVYGSTIGGQKLYVDGVERASGVKSSSDFNWQTAINIGFSQNAASAYLEGEIEHVRIWDITLASEQIAAAYASQDPIEPGAMRGSWTFDEVVDAQIVFDWSGAGNHGTLGETESIEDVDPMRVPSPFFQGSTDCNENGVLDSCEIADGTSEDLDRDGVPDECEVPPCPADLDGDGSVGAADLAQLLGAWGPNPGSAADLDGDDTVGAADLAQLLGNWGLCL